MYSIEGGDKMRHKRSKAEETGQGTVVATEPAKGPPAPIEVPKVRKSISRSWVLVILGVLLLIIAIPIGALWLANPLNNVIGLAAITLFTGGGILVYQGLKKASQGGVVKIQRGKRFKGDANVCNIIAMRNGDGYKPLRIEFDKAESPTGDLRQLTNDGKYYYFNLVRWDNDNDTVKPLSLPDNQSGLTPQEFVTAVMRENFRQFLASMQKPWDLQKVGVGILVGVMVIEILALIIIP